MGAGLEKYSEAGAGGRVSGNGALSGHNSFLTEGVVSGEQKFLPLLLRSRSAHTCRLCSDDKSELRGNKREKAT